MLRRAVIRSLSLGSQVLGFDPIGLVRGVAAVPRFVRSAREYARANRAAGDASREFPLRVGELVPMLHDRGDAAGTARGHYFHQDLWAARRIYARRPAKHLDVGSRIDGFVAHLLTFMPVTVLDVRPIQSDVAGLTFVQQDATRLEGLADQSVDSLSCLHAVEHFGLGRYGDPIDPRACFDAMAALARVLAPGGRLYFSVPIGRQRVEFNAHRVFAPDTVLKSFAALSLVSFCAVDDRGDFVADASPARFADASYACGLFEFTRAARLSLAHTG